MTDLTRDYPAYPEDERSDRARAVDFEGRYRGNRVMLLRSGTPLERVVRIQKVTSSPEGPGYVAETLAGEYLQIMEASIVVPDPDLVVEALARRGSGASEADPAAAALVSGYVWMSWDGLPGLLQADADAVVWAFVREAAAGAAWEPDDAIAVWSTREGCAGAMGPDAVVARLPFVAACRVAAGRHVAVDPGLPTAWVVSAASAARVAALSDPDPGPGSDGRVVVRPATRSRLGRVFGRS